MEMWFGRLFKKLRPTKRIWMSDFANAYRSVPHQMILLSLQMYHILEEISKMLGAYSDGFLLRFAKNNIQLEQAWTWNCDGMFDVTNTFRSSNAAASKSDSEQHSYSWTWWRISNATSEDIHGRHYMMLFCTADWQN